MNSRAEATQELCLRGVRWHLAPAAAGRLPAWLNEHFPSVLDSKAALLKADKGSRVATAAGLVIKESTARKRRSAYRFGFRRSGSRRAFRLGTALLALGLPTPRPLAWGTVRRLGLRLKDYLVTEYVADCRALKDKLDACRNDPVKRRRLMEQLGNLVALFHANGYSNRDMKDTNILVTEKDGPALWVVDLDGVRRPPLITRRRAARDFRPIAHSLSRHGMGTEEDLAGLLAGYSKTAPPRLVFDRFPDPSR